MEEAVSLLIKFFSCFTREFWFVDTYKPESKV